MEGGQVLLEKKNQEGIPKMIFSHFKKWYILSVHPKGRCPWRCPKNQRGVQELQSMSGRCCIFYFESDIKGKRPSASTFMSCIPSGRSSPGQGAWCSEKITEFGYRQPESHPQLCQEWLVHLRREGDLFQAWNVSSEKGIIIEILPHGVNFRVNFHNTCKMFCDFLNYKYLQSLSVMMGHIIFLSIWLCEQHVI